MLQTTTSWHRHIEIGLLIVGTLSLAQARASEGGDDVEVAGARAYYASEFCGISPDQIQHYKTRLKGTHSYVNDFEGHWKRGQDSEARRSLQFRALQKNDPEEYESRRKTNCSRIMWLAKNSVRNAK